MKVSRIIDQIESIAPLGHAEDWDNVGLLVGSGDWRTDRVLLTIDLTDGVMDEAINTRTRLIVTYHPILFEPVRRLTDATPAQCLALTAARRGIAVHSPHTALDAAPGGVNDWLAAPFGTGDVRALGTGSSLPGTEACKVVTFCPPDTAESIRNALASVGAGRIGVYERCSFETPGTGTFFAPAEADPAVGTTGHLERVGEVRLEMVCPRRSLALAVLSLREFHPYEEPPIEIYALEPRPVRDTGIGRRIVVDQPVALSTIVERFKKHLGVRQLRVAVADTAPRRYGTIGLCAGAGGSILEDALAQGCELYLTGEMRHHDVIAAQARGCTVILAGHTNTERGYLKVFKKKLGATLPGLEIRIARTDGDPLRLM